MIRAGGPLILLIGMLAGGLAVAARAALGAPDDGLIVPPPLSATDAVLAYLLPAAAGYMLGAIPFGFLLTRLAGLGDIRSIGSGNIGATNVLRTGHKGLAALTLGLDALKGTLAVILGYRIGARYGLAIDGSLLAGLGAFLGHIFPVWLGFRGGKGVATYIGVVGALVPVGALVFAAAWIATAALTRTSSLSALVASVVTPAALIALGHVPEGGLAALMTGLLMWKHADNIRRLIKGEEPKIGAKA